MTASTLTSHPNWRLALQILGQVLPGSATFEHDHLAGLEGAAWQPLVIDDRADIEIWHELRPHVLGQLRGLIVVVTFASYAERAGPFFVRGTTIDHLIASHAEILNDVFFSGDVTVVVPASGLVVAVHHDGGFATVQGRVSNPIQVP